MNILVAGGGKVGQALVKDLSAEGHDVTCIDTNREVLEKIVDKYDVITYEGNSAAMNSLLEAGIKDMDLFIAVTSKDEVNLLSCVTAKALHPDVPCIARIRDPEYSDQVYMMPDTFGLSYVINPERESSKEIARVIKYPGFLKRDVFSKGGAEMVEMKIDASSKLANLALKDLKSATHSSCLICAVSRSGETIMPDGNFVIKEGDRIYVTGDPKQLHLLLTNTGVITKPVKNVMISGGSKIAYYLAQELIKAHMEVKIIDNDETKCMELTEALPEAVIVKGDVSNHATLESEDADQFGAFVSLTGLDELNIVTSLYAHKSGVPVIVTKMGRGEDSLLTDSLPIGSIVCPKELITAHIIRYVRALQNKKGAAVTIHKIADGGAMAIEFEVAVDSPHIGTPFKNVRTNKNALIAAIVRNGKVEIPDGNSSYQAGDTVIVAAHHDLTVNTLDDIFED